MELRLKNNKGQTDIVGAIGGFIMLIVALVVGLMIVGQLEDSTVGDCTYGYLNKLNDTVLNSNVSITHGVVLPSLLTGSQKLAGSLVVNYTYAAEGNCTVAVNGYNVGTIGNESPQTFAVALGYLANPTTITYAYCNGTTAGENTTILFSNMTYYALSSCDYTADAYDAMDTTYDMNFTAMGLLPVVILIMTAVIVIGAVLVLRRQ